MKFKIIFLSGIAFTIFTDQIGAQGLEEWDAISPNDLPNHLNTLSNSTEFNAPDFSGALFIGTSSNINQASATLNDVFATQINNQSQAILSAHGVWGATADPINQRVLFTQASGLTPAPDTIGGGDNLYELSYLGGDPLLLGQITLDGIGIRIDGLALRKGILYGYNAGNGNNNGFYQIDLDTLQANLITNPGDSINGIDADPQTCIIYGTNDTTGQVVQISTNGTVTALVDYPIGITDIDGLAVGEGYAYLITDEAQDMSVLNLATLQYEMSITSPFATADTFSGGAIAIADPSIDSNFIFTNGFEINHCAD